MQLRRKNASKLNPNGQREVANEPQDVWIESFQSVRILLNDGADDPI
jgi:hypothetical protein